jgi:hypothetical protein
MSPTLTSKVANDAGGSRSSIPRICMAQRKKPEKQQQNVETIEVSTSVRHQRS